MQDPHFGAVVGDVATIDHFSSWSAQNRRVCPWPKEAVLSICVQVV